MSDTASTQLNNILQNRLNAAPSSLNERIAARAIRDSQRPSLDDRIAARAERDAQQPSLEERILAREQENIITQQTKENVVELTVAEIKANDLADKTEEKRNSIEQRKAEKEQKLGYDKISVQDAGDQSVLREFADIPLKLGQGAVTGIRIVADAFGADNDLSNSLEGIEEDIGALMSAQSKKDSAEIARIQAAAEGKGTWEEIKAFFEAASVAPVDLIANALGTAAPAIIGGIVATATAPVSATAAALTIGTVMGAGVTKGAIFDATEEAFLEAGVSPEQAKKAATEAQEYGGKNTDSILLGSALGYAATRLGIDPKIINSLTRKVTGKLAAKTGTKKGILRDIAEEAIPEAAQGGHEQFAANLAQQREGFDVDLGAGVVFNAGLEGLAGAGMGAIGAVPGVVDGATKKAAEGIVAVDKKLNPTEEESESTETVEGESETPKTKGFKETLKDIKNDVTEVFTKSKEAVESQVKVNKVTETNDPAKIKEALDPNNDEFTKEEKVLIASEEANRTDENTSPQVKEERKEQVQTALYSWFNDLQTEFDELVAKNSKEERSSEDQTRINEIAKQKQTLAGRVRNLAELEKRENLTSKEFDEAIQEIKDNDAPPDTIVKMLGSKKIRHLTNKQLKQTRDDPNIKLPDNEKKLVDTQISINDQVEKLNKAYEKKVAEGKNPAFVHMEIVEGTPENMGFLDYLNNVIISKEGQDEVSTKKARAGLQKFLDRHTVKRNDFKALVDAENKITRNYTSKGKVAPKELYVVVEEAAQVLKDKYDWNHVTIKAEDPKKINTAKPASIMHWMDSEVKIGQEVSVQADNIIDGGEKTTETVETGKPVPVSDQIVQDDNQVSLEELEANAPPIEEIDNTVEAVNLNENITEDDSVSPSGVELANEESVEKPRESDTPASSTVESDTPINFDLTDETNKKTNIEEQVVSFVKDLRTIREYRKAQGKKKQEAPPKNGKTDYRPIKPVVEAIKASNRKIVMDSKDGIYSLITNQPKKAEIRGLFVTKAQAANMHPDNLIRAGDNLDAGIFEDFGIKPDTIDGTVDPAWIVKVFNEGNFDVLEGSQLAQDTQMEEAITKYEEEIFKTLGLDANTANAGELVAAFRKHEAGETTTSQTNNKPETSNNTDEVVNDVVDEDIDVEREAIQEEGRSSEEKGISEDDGAQLQDRTSDPGQANTSEKESKETNLQKIIRDSSGGIYDTKTETMGTKPYINKIFNIKKLKGVANNVLHNIVNWAETYTEEGTEANQHFKEKNFTPHEEDLINDFVAFNEDVNNVLFEGDDEYEPMLKPFSDHSRKYKRDNLINFFYNQEYDKNDPDTSVPILDPNMVTALSFTLYEWIAVNGYQTLQMDDRTISTFVLGADHSKVTPTDEMYALYKDKGVKQTVIAEALGRNFLKSIGFEVKSNQAHYFESESAIQLGNFILSVGMQTNLLERTGVKYSDKIALKEKYYSENDIKEDIDPFDDLLAPTTEEEANALSAKNSAKERAEEIFVRVIPDTPASFGGEVTETIDYNKKPNQRVQRIRKRYKNAQSTFYKLFGAVSPEKPPSFEKLESIKDIPHTIKKSNLKIAQEVREILFKKSQEPYSFNHTFQTFNRLNKSQMIRLMGGKTINEMKEVHPKLKEKYLAKNIEIEKFIDDFKTFKNSMSRDHGHTDVEFFYEFEIWRNSRIGMKNNILNYQNSKVARQIVGLKEMKSTISLTDSIENNFDMTLFMLAVGQGMGIDEKQTYTEIIADTQALFEDSPAKEVMEDLIQYYREDSVQADKNMDRLTNMAIHYNGKESIHALAAMDAWARFQAALRDGKDSFETTLTREIDGKTNGVAHAVMQIAWGDSREDFLNKVGIFSDKNTVETSNEYFRDLNNSDTYQTLTLALDKHLDLHKEKLKEDSKLELLAKTKGVEGLIGTLTEIIEKSLVSTSDGRTFSKDPVMKFVYGAEVASIIKAITVDSVEKIYSDIESNKNDKAKLGLIYENLKTILGKDINITQEDYVNPLKFSLSSKQEKLIRTAIEKTYSAPLNGALNDTFGQIKFAKKTMQKAYDNVGRIFDTVYYDLYAQKILHNEGRPLTIAQEQEILATVKDMIPRITTAISDSSSDTGAHLIERNLSNEYVGGKFDSIIAGLEATGFAESKKNKEKLSHLIAENKSRDGKNVVTKIFPGKQKIRNSGTPRYPNGVSQLVGKAQHHEISLNANKAMVHGIHSTDSMNMLENYKGEFLMGIHDAIMVGINNELNGVATANNNFLKVNANYNVLNQSIKDLEKVIENYKKYKKGLAAPRRKLLDMILPPEVIQEKMIDWMNTGSDSNPNFGPKQQGEAALKRAKITAQTVKRNGLNDQFQANHPKDKIPTDGKKIDIKDSIYLRDLDRISKEEQRQTEDNVKREVEGKEPLGSGPTPHDEYTFNPDKIWEVNGDGVLKIFDFLGEKGLGNKDETPEHAKYLRNLLVTYGVEKSVNDLIVKLEKKGDDTHGFAVTRKDGKKEVHLISASKASANGIRMSAQEAYAHEILHIISEDYINANSKAKYELTRLFHEVRNDPTIDYRAFLRDPNNLNNQAENEAAEARYNYIFNNDQTSEVKSHDEFTTEEHTTYDNPYLQEFFALGLTNENFLRALSKRKSPKEKEIKKPTLYDRLLKFLVKAMGFFDKRYVNNRKENFATQLDFIAKRLLENKEKSKQKVTTFNTVTQFVNNKAIYPAFNMVVGSVKAASRTKFLKHNRFKVVRDTAGIVEHAKFEHFPQYIKFISDVRKRAGISADNISSSIFREVQGNTAGMRFWHRLLVLSNRKLDQNHKTVDNEVRAEVLGAFLKLTEKDSHSITKGYIRNDLSVLDSDYTLDQIADLVDPSNKTYLQGEIDSIIDQLKAKFKSEEHVYTFYDHMSESLANVMVEGRATWEDTYGNAYSIAKMYGTEYANKIKDEDFESTEKLIDMLVSMRAIQKTDINTNKNLHKVMVNENKRKDSTGGIDFITQLLKENKRRSLEELFNGHKAEVRKGFSKEIYAPNVTFKYARPEDEARMFKQGYLPVSNTDGGVTLDPSHKGVDELVMYVNNNSELTTLQRGIVAMHQETTIGTNIIDFNTQRGNSDPKVAQRHLKQIHKFKAPRKKEVFKPNGISMDPKKDNLLIPVNDPKGKIVDYRYIMKETTKDNILERDNSFEKVLGKMEAGIDDKLNARIINRKVVKALHNEYVMQSPTATPGEFVKVGPNADTKENREIWQMFPADMRRELKKVFKSDDIYVRGSIMKLVFGQRKFSLSDYGSKQARYGEDQGLFSGILSFFLNRPQMRRFEAFLQDLIKIIKDIIVIKSVSVLIDNVISNFVVLMMRGMSFSDIIRYKKEALIAAKQYKKLISKEHRLLSEIARKEQSKTSAGVKSIPSIDREIAKLNASLDIVRTEISKNAVRELSEAGVHQTIVEDVSLEDNDNRLRNTVEKQLEPMKKFIPKFMQSAAKNVFLTQDTQAYKALRDITQMSDFVGRYALHQHNTKIEKMNFDDSVEDIFDAFIHYDLPTHKGIQYLNDVGIWMFTKFFFRIQKVILRMLTGSYNRDGSRRQGNPAATAAMLASQILIGDFADIYESGVFTGSGSNTFSLNVPGTVFKGLFDGFGVNLAQETF